MFCVVIDLCKKFYLFRTVTFKHGIVNNKNIGTVYLLSHTLFNNIQVILLAIVIIKIFYIFPWILFCHSILISLLQVPASQSFLPRLPHHRLHFLISIKLYPVYSSIFSFSSIISTSCLMSFSQNNILHFFYISFNVFYNSIRSTPI